MGNGQIRSKVRSSEINVLSDVNSMTNVCYITSSACNFCGVYLNWSINQGFWMLC